jgi:hypothetical protein
MFPAGTVDAALARLAIGSQAVARAQRRSKALRRESRSARGRRFLENSYTLGGAPANKLGAELATTGAGTPAGDPETTGMSSVTIRPSFSKTAERGSTERSVQPESLSPSRILVTAFDWSLRKTASRVPPPMIVPSRVKGGGKGGAGGSAIVGGGGEGAAATAGGGGRRDEENSGRSRVAESVDKGIAHEGLPGFTTPAAGVGVSTTTGVAGATSPDWAALS